jgi:hypothetical protein
VPSLAGISLQASISKHCTSDESFRKVFVDFSAQKYGPHRVTCFFLSVFGVGTEDKSPESDNPMAD